MNPEIDADIPALIGASAALTLAGIRSTARSVPPVGYINGQYVLNPTRDPS